MYSKASSYTSLADAQFLIALENLELHIILVILPYYVTQVAQILSYTDFSDLKKHASQDSTVYWYVYQLMIQFCLDLNYDLKPTDCLILPKMPKKAQKNSGSQNKKGRKCF